LIHHVGVKPNGARPYPSRAQWLRRLALKKRDRVAFVLSGGGPLGALQVGALKALFEAGIRPDLCVGTSVGALNATFVSFDPTLAGIARLERVWKGLSEQELFPGGRLRASWARMLVRGNRVFDNSGIRKLVESRLGEARFEEAQVPFAVVATEVDSGKEALFSSGPVIEPLLASAAMPGIYPPVEIEGRSYIDGGVANNVPIAPAVEMGATTAYVMDATSHSRQRRPLTRPIDYLLHAFSLARSQRLHLDLQIYGDKVHLVMIPTVPLGFFVPFASLDHTEKLIEMSYDYTRRFLQGEPSREPEAAFRT
jgi:NTE family protein